MKVAAVFSGLFGAGIGLCIAMVFAGRAEAIFLRLGLYKSEANPVSHRKDLEELRGMLKAESGTREVVEQFAKLKERNEEAAAIAVPEVSRYLIRKKRPDEALRICDWFLRTFPKSWNLLTVTEQKGKALAAAEDWSKAREVFEAAFVLARTNYDKRRLLLEMAEAAEGAGDRKSASVLREQRRELRDPLTMRKGPTR